MDWRALWGLGVVNGLGSYEVKVSWGESDGVIGEGVLGRVLRSVVREWLMIISG